MSLHSGATISPSRRPASPAISTSKYARPGYDPSGNRTFEQIDNAITAATHDSLNRVLTQAAGGMLTVAGTLNEPATVMVQGRPATVDAANAFRGTAWTTDGTKTLTIAATDARGNQSTQQYAVNVTGSNKTFSLTRTGTSRPTAPPIAARWLSEDPAGRQDGPDVYSYGMNNPVRYSDPTGLTAWKCSVDLATYGTFPAIVKIKATCTSESVGGRQLTQSLIRMGTGVSSGLPASYSYAEYMVRVRRAEDVERYAASQRQAPSTPNLHEIDAVIFALRRLREGGLAVEICDATRGACGWQGGGMSRGRMRRNGLASSLLTMIP
jgi:hypothetical protein